MQYARYGKEGPRISRLGFGVMRLPCRPKDSWGKVNVAASVRLLRAAMEAGVNFFDSHHNYHEGGSELAIGRALKGWKGQPIVVQTKTPWYKDKPRAYFEKLLYEALEKLGVNCIDYLLHHSMDMEMFRNKGRQFIRFTDWAMNRGLIRHRGFSSHDKPQNIKKFVDTGEFAVMVVSFNWMNPQVKEAIAYAAEHGMGVTIMNPIAGGMLATDTPQVMRLLPGARSAAEVALRYVLATPGVTCALSGMNAPDQLAENTAIAARRAPMTALQRRRMQQRLDRIEKTSRELCAGCGYCMPCRHGVDIPSNMRALNQLRLFGQIEWARSRYGRLRKHKEGNRSAEACRQCGRCEPKCPIHVPIIQRLAELKKRMG